MIAAALLAATWIASFLAYQPGAARGGDTPLAEFSAARAGVRLQHLLSESFPHPMGSAANAVVRERILADLRELGYEPEIQSGIYECDAYAVCGTPVNVVARLAGRSDTASSVLLAAHYDSVPAGPGASDDGAGVAAVLEIARALKQRPPPLHPIVFLIGDGEELGLLGARVFVDHHPWAQSVKAAVNLDNRGTSGPALMFETGTANAWLMGLYARATRNPLTNSVYYTVYKQLPNNTDFTVFKAAGYQGFNFAFIGSVARYHTPGDDVAHADLRSIEAQGEAALSLVLALSGTDPSAATDQDQPPTGEAVYFDLLRLALVRVPQAVMLPAAAVTLSAVLVLVVLFARQGDGFVRQFSGSIAVSLLAWSVAVLLSYGIVTGVHWLAPSSLPEFSAVPWIGEVAFGALGALTIACVSLLLRGRTRFWSFWCAHLLLIAMLATVTAVALPGASYLFLLPAIAGVAAGFAGWWTARGNGPVTAGPDDSGWVVVVAAAGYLTVMFALLWPILVPLYAGLGKISLPLIALLIVVGGGPLAGLLMLTGRRVNRAIAAGCGFLVLAGIVLMRVIPAYTAESPEPLNIRYWLEPAANGEGRARWLLVSDRQQAPREFQPAARFERLAREPYDPFLDFGDAKVFAAAAPAADLPRPQCVVLSATTMGVHSAAQRAHYRLHVSSPRAAAVLAVAFAPAAGVELVAVSPTDTAGGTMVTASPVAWRGGWRVIAFAQPGPAGIELEFEAARAPFDVEVLDRSYGLPPGGGALQAARSAAMTAIQDGDVTLATLIVRIAAPAEDRQTPR